VTIVVPSGTTQLKIQAIWPTFSSGDKFYVNDVDVTLIAPQASPEYQYYLKDHLGNVH
jgi:hypothetical protein